MGSQTSVATEHERGSPDGRDNEAMNLSNAPGFVRVRVGEKPVASREADIRKHAHQLRVLCGSVVVENPNAVARSDGLKLGHNAAALVAPPHEIPERRCVVEGAAVDEILNVRDEEVVT